jgi:hypothetical protein
MTLTEAYILTERLSSVPRGMEALVTRVINKLGKKDFNRRKVMIYLRDLEKKDPAFIEGIKKRSKGMSSPDGFIWSSITNRAVRHFS